MKKGRLIGVGVGPGDPDLLTLRAVETIRQSRHVAYMAAEGEPSLARRIAERHLTAAHEEMALEAPMRSEPAIIGGFYDTTAARIAALLDKGEDVALLCLGDPLLYGTFIYVLDRLRGRHDWQVVPGITSAGAAAAAAGRVLARRKDSFAILPAMMDPDKLERLLAVADSAAILKVGARVAMLKTILARQGLLEGALLLSWVGWPEERIEPFAAYGEASAPYFSLLLVDRDART